MKHLLASLLILLAAPAFAQVPATPLKVYVCTDPGRPGLSQIPPDIRAACDVEDVFTTTNAPGQGVSVAEVARRAKAAGCRVLVDCETEVTNLGAYLYGAPGYFDAKLAARVAAVREARAVGKSKVLQLGIYDGWPAKVGMNREGWTWRQYRGLLKREDAALRPLLDFKVIEVYVFNNVIGKDDAETLKNWQTNLDWWIAAAAIQGGSQETLVLICPWVNTKPDNAIWTPMPDAMFKAQLERVHKEGLSPLLWNPQDQGWAVIREVAKKQ